MADSKSKGSSDVVERKVTSLSAFLQLAQNSQVSKSSALEVQSRVGTLIAGPAVSGGLSISAGEGAKFANGVAEIVTSKEFTQELSEAVGKPHISETEDEFVARAKDQMRALLRRKLSKD